MPGWIVWPLCLNRYITAPQDNAAKSEKYLESGGKGLAGPPVAGDVE